MCLGVKGVDYIAFVTKRGALPRVRARSFANARSGAFARLRLRCACAACAVVLGCPCPSLVPLFPRWGVGSGSPLRLLSLARLARRASAAPARCVCVGRTSVRRSHAERRSLVVASVLTKA